MDLSILLLDGFVKTDTWISLSCRWICQNWFMDFSRLLHKFVKLIHGFVKVVLCISRPIANKTKFDHDFQSLLNLLLCLNKSCWINQSTQSLGSAVPLAIFLMYVGHAVFSSNETWTVLLSTLESMALPVCLLCPERPLWPPHPLTRCHYLSAYHPGISYRIPPTKLLFNASLRLILIYETLWAFGES